MVVVLEVVLQTPFVLESAKAEVAERVVVPRVIDMVLETITVFEDSDAEVAIILMIWNLLHVVLERSLARKLDVASTTPVLMRIMRLVAHSCSIRDCTCARSCV